MAVKLHSEFKTQNLLTMPWFNQLKDEEVDQRVQFKINSLKQKNQLVLGRISELSKILEEQNPSLFRFVQEKMRGSGSTKEGKENQSAAAFTCSGSSCQF